MVRFSGGKEEGDVRHDHIPAVRTGERFSRGLPIWSNVDRPFDFEFQMGFNSILAGKERGA